MRHSFIVTLAAACAALTALPAFGDDAVPSAERGHVVAVVSGCHDCHSAGYPESGGILDPATALAGSGVGFRGPWGTTYPSNLRLVAAERDEAGFVKHLSTLKTLPPMPYFNLHAMPETDIRSLFLYIRSLGEPGEPAPAYVPPGEEPTTPYIVFAPPTMPAG
ncbi:cytochrome C [Aurantimonas aggregata]|uniref:Cytochrome C n=1 Tax=Aurantimonas aggregata TaxID=2047720 RepID=A0A6L9MI59_9HYPH|nr:cytochrome C [Aurantimonas aggregata]NDV87519.1 cytochrome C [Aurantimonas aggregata]